jgi:serine/threonine protein kinase
MSDPSVRYTVIRSLGQGSMGEVFLAEDALLERQVALKFLPAELREDARARERFEREAKAAAALDHPFICKIHPP